MVPRGPKWITYRWYNDGRRQTTASNRNDDFSQNCNAAIALRGAGAKTLTATKKLLSEEKVNIQQYITRCYGSLTYILM